MNLINESLEKIIKGTDIVEQKEVKVVDKKMQKLLQEAINNVNLRNHNIENNFQMIFVLLSPEKIYLIKNYLYQG